MAKSGGKGLLKTGTIISNSNMGLWSYINSRCKTIKEHNRENVTLRKQDPKLIDRTIVKLSELILDLKSQIQYELRFFILTKKSSMDKGRSHKLIIKVDFINLIWNGSSLVQIIYVFVNYFVLYV